jgi:hypothetical protein
MATMLRWLFTGKGSGCLGVTIEHNLQEILGDIEFYTDFKMLKVKVLY